MDRYQDSLSVLNALEQADELSSEWENDYYSYRKKCIEQRYLPKGIDASALVTLVDAIYPPAYLKIIRTCCDLADELFDTDLSIEQVEMVVDTYFFVSIHSDLQLITKQRANMKRLAWLKRWF